MEIKFKENLKTDTCSDLSQVRPPFRKTTSEKSIKSYENYWQR
jgi:hypothetical protein